MERLRCVAERITYANETNGYTVLKARVKNVPDLVTVIGSLATVCPGAVLSLTGEWKVDKKYGRQFAAVTWEETMPATALGIQRYLGSGLIKGVGPKFAERIVAKFGAETLEILETQPDRLLTVAGIGARRVATIKKAWQEQKEIKNIMLFLQEHQVSAAHAVRIFKTYGGDSVAVVRENPYRLADDVWGIGFRTADTIARKMGFDPESAYRCRSGLFYTLNQLANDGHCFAPRGRLLRAGAELLEVPEPKLDAALTLLLAAGELIEEAPDRIYLPSLWASERGVCQRLRAISAGPAALSGADIESGIKKAAEAGVAYDDIQKDAIRQALTAKVSVLTGGPGTGKTTTTGGIIAVFRGQGRQVLLAAPTGRAAKRLSEATGLEAKTIHRLLEYQPPAGYKKNADYPLEGDALIVDEASMIDIVLLYNLLKAVPDTMSVIFVGDADQLPSVGPGSALLDIISSGVVPVTRLTQIYRQAQSSRIIINAHRINRGEMPDLNGGRNSDFFFLAEDDPANIPAIIRELCVKRLPAYYQVDPIQGIQVLSPMQRGDTGAANLNALLQEALNPAGECLRRGGMAYRLRDKVMQIKNNYDKEVFNGDIGVISGVDAEERELRVTFDSRAVSYDVSELDELTLAYATTIHKAQGSEYPIVVMPFTMQHYVMLQRNLLYTGVTRAKKALVLVGTKKALGFAIRNHAVLKRDTGLAERLTALFADTL
ncbi:MAG: ATP-dependent RecD-like DNA helicase [Peptococcaceae bacterium]|nr:ATP-dependent RecD-like DNA helicase [Peptococcaceae bacterium]